jgi:hypothetical protein
VLVIASSAAAASATDARNRLGIVILQCYLPRRSLADGRRASTDDA